MSSTRARILSPRQLEAVARLFAVMSEPSRLVLLHALHDGSLTVNELVEKSGMKQANVSKHLAALHDQHLVHRQRDGNCVKYAIGDPIVFSLCDLVCRKMERDAKKAVALFAPEI